MSDKLKLSTEELLGLTRRDFLRGGAAGALLSGGSFGFLNALMSREVRADGLDPAAEGNRLIVVQLGGGNDTLNTIVPYAHEQSGTYYAARPQLSISAGQVLDLDGTFGFHPSMPGLKGLWDDSELAILHGVGYPQPQLSHFSSTDKWHSGMPSGAPTSGWLERFFSYLGEGAEISPLAGIEFASRASLAFGGGKGRVTISRKGEFSVQNTNTEVSGDVDRLRTLLSSDTPGFDRSKDSPVLGFVREVCESALAASDLTSAVADSEQGDYPESDFGLDLKRAADLIKADLPTKVFYVHRGGFDNHAGQFSGISTVGVHANLLADVSSSIAAFAADMKSSGHWENTLVMVFSEFSRKVIQNGNSGTDHGAGQGLIFAGGSLNAGMHGTFPSMLKSDRVQNDSLQFSTDFRQVYRTVLERWLGVESDAIPAIFPDAPTDFSLLPFLSQLS